MAARPGAQDRHACRGAVLALHHAVATLRQHPEDEPLLRAALRHCADAMLAAAEPGPLRIPLQPGTVVVAGERVLTFAPGEPPFGPLRRAGIGELEFDGCPPADELERLVRCLAAIPRDAEPERALQGLLAAAALPHLHLHAATTDGAGDEDAPVDWSLVPVLAHVPAALQAFVARELASNLPAMAARQLLEDPGAAGDDGADLVRLLARMLDDGDLASACWLLAEIDQHPEVPDAARAAACTAAVACADDRWLQDQLDHGTRDELRNLVAFVMQLGGDVADHFARLVDASAHPFARWLGALLPGPRRE